MKKTDGSFGNMTIDPGALWDDILTTARFGATPKGGLRRLALTEEDRQVRAWFTRTCTALGATVWTDTLGNQFARVSGTDASLPPIALGSHLDTQPTGGRFDGIIGVLGGIAVLRALRETKHRTRHPVEIVNWTNEEGSRFAPAMLASGVFAGVFTEDYARNRQDREGVSFGAALEAIGAIGEESCGAHGLAAYLELHIEQGPILEAEGCVIGTVTGVQGMRWYDVTVTGRDSHSGTTPMPLRADALQAAALLMTAVREIALAHAPEAVGTVGSVEVLPNSRNVVPGEVLFTVDFRDPRDETVMAMENAFRAKARAVAEEHGVTVEIRDIWDSPAVPFDRRLIDAVSESARELGLPAREIVSGAGHDAAYVARIVPTTMIFVPCAGGLSHNEEESATPDDVAAGANVLLRSLLKADALL
ncbi:Zn-dependent hydrolase [Acidomonas methanolica]|uniref:Amidohydrolase/hydantoinase/carbamoylase family amidase n=1 Tax=Acidomonas methanolica NBRC 104435 TaxID=1231351 RepID=A0A023D3X6_ACIMT|nr:Zn-dependent hydrolase [Acidomonas methanolica]MBU2653666.1 Zn-dependent hydrolase [Acidomonas methanolica]TCS31618.1 N-carbamoyl-L-amino-acid hydrolase [Acidomonas methanolica]GAJ28832.1 amidohydrolase/hydantoinase/carbamoylase family amidase [Acidomonas methanolica NBRC 104435]GBQ51729.1 N-carbamyl-L-amino acid amidohydrolase [Acidomonas methanolica]GEK98036.1 Zn-dependent hydrolase [Acidomonas methanolica NBRC 104435]